MIVCTLKITAINFDRKVDTRSESAAKINTVAKLLIKELVHGERFSFIFRRYRFSELEVSIKSIIKRVVNDPEIVRQKWAKFVLTPSLSYLSNFRDRGKNVRRVG